MAWGNGAISGTASYGTVMPLRCGSCHDPHGNGNYRILRPIPDESGAGTGVTIADASTKTYTTENYWLVEDESAPGFIANVLLLVRHLSYALPRRRRQWSHQQR